MAIGIDLAYVTLKITLLTASDGVRKQVGWLPKRRSSARWPAALQ
jgi:hypothetical protein